MNETVELIPANTTDKIKMSCEPIPVYLVLEENGVIKVHPAVVNVRFEHFVKKNFFSSKFYNSTSCIPKWLWIRNNILSK